MAGLGVRLLPCAGCPLTFGRNVWHFASFVFGTHPQTGSQATTRGLAGVFRLHLLCSLLTLLYDSLR